eukprot:12763303-Alexandrium_andersonii.AAC.1
MEAAACSAVLRCHASPGEGALPSASAVRARAAVRRRRRSAGEPRPVGVRRSIRREGREADACAH